MTTSSNLRNESGIKAQSYTDTVFGSILECAGECVKQRCCSAFNFGSRQCELLSVAASDRTSASGWTHGYTGKYHTRKAPSGKCSYCKAVSAKAYIYVYLFDKNSKLPLLLTTPFTMFTLLECILDCWI